MSKKSGSGVSQDIGRDRLKNHSGMFKTPDNSEGKLSYKNEDSSSKKIQE